MVPLKTGRPVQALAYNLAVAELGRSHPEAVEMPEVMSMLLGAVLDQASAGKTDPEEIARYAVTRGVLLFQSSQPDEAFPPTSASNSSIR